MTDDIDAQLTLARDDLARLDDALDDLWRHLPDDDWQPEADRGSPGHRSRPAWDGPTVMQRAWITVSRELARSHAACRAAEGDDRAGAWGQRLTAVTAELCPTIGLVEARAATRALTGRLESLRGETLGGQHTALVLEACGHARAAYLAVPEGLDGKPSPAQRAHQRRSRHRRCQNPNGCPNPARPRGTQCAACATYRSRHGRDRIVGDDGRAA